MNKLIKNNSTTGTRRWMLHNNRLLIAMVGTEHKERRWGVQQGRMEMCEELRWWMEQQEDRSEENLLNLVRLRHRPPTSGRPS